jgi:Holliday junction resolvasome RuvABC endonuclease subunit
MKTIKIVGLDPSLRNFGIAIATLNLETMELRIDDLRLVETGAEGGKVVRKNSDDLRRAKMSYDGMVAACNGASFAIAEVPVGSQSARAMLSCGVCIGVLAACPIPLIQVTPSEVKLAAIGEKNASKIEMIEWGMTKYPDANWMMRKSKGIMVAQNCNEHLADAVAAIEAGLKTEQFKAATAMLRGLKAA